MEKMLVGCLLMLGQLLLVLPVGARERRPQDRFPSRGRRMHPQTALLESSCENKRADLVFIIDSSRSVNTHDYAKVKEFILDILQFLDIGPDITRVGLLQYGSTVKNEFSLKTFKRKSDVERAVKRMRHLSTGTMTGLAIQYALNIAFSEAEGARPLRENVPRVIMIVTDGRPQDSVAEVASKARNTGILIFAIGVGQVDLNTLKAIGSEPHKDHVFLVANFSQIESLTSVFQNKLCTVHMCSVLEHNCAHFCINTPGSYTCKCKQGYILGPDQKTCRIQDLCATEDHGCEQLCVNMLGSFVCHCYSGYTLAEDGKQCTAVDYCASENHRCEHECVNAEGSYLCRCHEGFALNVDKKTCSKIDYCASSDHGCQHECVNAQTSAFCRCLKGFMLNPDRKTCRRINYCALNKPGCEHECVNTEEGHYCRCRRGYTLDPNGKTCSRVDHCAQQDHGCEQLCLNTEESFVCQCSEGFLINDDLKTCSRADYCLLSNHGCEYSCVNTDKSFACQCPEGHVLRSDGKTCAKLDSCALGDHGCEHSCVSSEDSFVCRCFEGYVLRDDGKTCRREDVCQAVDHGCEHLCVNSGESYICKCLEGFRLAEDGKRCRRKDVCKSIQHGCEHICVNNGNSYLCRCSEGFVLAEDGRHCKRCTEGPIDLVFVIDGSKSLGEENFEIVKHFVTGIIDSLAVSPKAARVGLLQYSTQVRTEFTLKGFSSAKDMKKAVAHMKYMGKGSMTGLALKHMYERSFTQGSWGPAEPWAAGLGNQQKNMAPWTLWRCCQRVVGWVPVLFITFVVVWSYYAYVVELCVSTVSRTGEKGKTVVYLVAFHLFFVMFVWSYWMTIFTSPASPSKEFYLSNSEKERYEKEFSQERQQDILRRAARDLPVYTTSASKAIRYCEKCQLIKPDRAHHCSACDRCVLKMDHHCPWVNNCVGFTNYKFFMLFLLYSLLYCLFVAATVLEYFIKFWTNEPTVLTFPSAKFPSAKFHVLFLFFVSAMFFVSVLSLFSYHCWLVGKNRTTIESFRAPMFSYGIDGNGFSLGCSKNWRQVFGDEKKYWLVPIFSSLGDGCSFPTRLVGMDPEQASIANQGEYIRSIGSNQPFPIKPLSESKNRLLDSESQWLENGAEEGITKSGTNNHVTVAIEN